MGVDPERAYRWFDDYELAFDTRAEAEAALKKLSHELSKFQLRINPKKTRVLALPQTAAEDWQAELSEASLREIESQDGMLAYFDKAFMVQARFPDAPVLVSALGRLFSIRRPKREVDELAQSCITQALLTEPGTAQRAFSLLTFWKLNGLVLNGDLLSRTMVRMILGQESSGFNNDVAWALTFCVQQQISLNEDAAEVLSEFADDCTSLLSLHMRKEKLLTKGFNVRRINAKLKSSDLDRDHWLIAYESVRHGFSRVAESNVKNNKLFADLLARGVTFYRPTLPVYALVIHPGGVPESILHRMADGLRRPRSIPAKGVEATRVFELMREHVSKVGARDSDDELIAALLDVFEPEAFPAEVSDETYSV